MFDWLIKFNNKRGVVKCYPDGIYGYATRAGIVAKIYNHSSEKPYAGKLCYVEKIEGGGCSNDWATVTFIDGSQVELPENTVVKASIIETLIFMNSKAYKDIMNKKATASK